MSAVLEEYAQEKSEEVVVAEININEYFELAGRYKVTNLPTMILFQNGQIRWRYEGETDKNNIDILVRGALS